MEKRLVELARLVLIIFPKLLQIFVIQMIAVDQPLERGLVDDSCMTPAAFRRLEVVKRRRSRQKKNAKQRWRRSCECNATV